MSKNVGSLQDKDGNLLFPNVVDVVTNNNGTAIKFANGIMICCGTVSMGNQTFNTVYWTNLHRSNNEDMYITYPVPFTTIISCNMNANVGTGWVITKYAGSLVQTPKCVVVAPSGYTDTQEVKLSYCAIGTWK